MVNDKMKKSLRIVAWIVGVPVALLLLVMALSPVAKPVINNHGQDFIGRDMSVKSVFINPFFGTVTIRDFHCKEANGLTDFVAFDRLHVQMNWLALAGKHVNLSHIHLDEFTGQVLSGANDFNFSDIVRRFASNDTTPKDTTPSQWTVSLRDIQLRNGRLSYHDMVRDNRWSVDNVNLNVPGLYFGPQQSNAGLQFSLPTGGSVTVTAGYIMASQRYAVTFRLDQVNTDVALPLVQDYLKVSGLGALVSGSIHIDGSLNNVRDMVLSGGLGLSGLNITDEDDEPVAGLDNIRLVIRRGDIAANSFLLDTVSITGVTANFVRTDKYNTLSRLLREPDEQTADSISEEIQIADNDSLQISGNTVDQPLTWSTRHLLVTAHDIAFEDKSVKPHVKYSIDTLSLSGNNIAGQGKNSLHLSGRFSDGAKLNADYVGGLDLSQGNHRLNLKLTGMQLPAFSPYVVDMFACPVEQGELAAQIGATVNGGKLLSDNKITIDQPQIGKKARRSKAKYKNVPLKLGVDMLKSAHGIVVLEVPVKGDITSPKFKLGKVIGRAVAKVFFGPLMGVRDNRELISADEMNEMLDILGPDTAAFVQNDTIPLEQ